MCMWMDNLIGLWVEAIILCLSYSFPSSFFVSSVFLTDQIFLVMCSKVVLRVLEGWSSNLHTWYIIWSNAVVVIAMPFACLGFYYILCVCLCMCIRCVRSARNYVLVCFFVHVCPTVCVYFCTCTKSSNLYVLQEFNDSASLFGLCHYPWHDK